MALETYEQVSTWLNIATKVPTRKDRANSVKLSDGDKRENNDDDLFYFDPCVDVKRNDIIVYDDEDYDVLKVNKSYDGTGVHHLEVLARYVDNN